MKFLIFVVLILPAIIFTDAANISAQKKNSNAAIRRANADADGDGITDFIVARGTTAASSAENGAASISLDKAALPKSFRERMKARRLQQLGQSPNAPAAAGTPLVWFTNANKKNGSNGAAQFGTSDADFPIVEDFDGDGKDDQAVWRPNAAADGSGGFFVLQSSNGAVTFEKFGADGDDPTVTADYDGDGKADPAVFRCPYDAPAQCHFFYLGSSNNPKKIVSTIPFGYGTANDITAAPGDYDGDGKNDFCVFLNRGGNVGQFVIAKSSDGAIEYVNWGLFSDTIVPGDFDGDGKADFMVTRNQDGHLAWYLLTRKGGGTGASPYIWGLSDSDYAAPGDYDGDGKTDLAVWRADLDPDKNFYYVERSTNGAMLSFEWGQYNDFPVQNWYVH